MRWQSPLPCSPRRAHRTKPPSRPLCAAEQNRETDQVRKARNEALAKAITILTQRAGKVSRAVGEALAKEGGSLSQQNVKLQFRVQGNVEVSSFPFLSKSDKAPESGCNHSNGFNSLFGRHLRLRVAQLSQNASTLLRHVLPTKAVYCCAQAC